MEGYRFIDSDAHIFEPENIWDNYLESKYRSEISSFVNYKRRSEAGSAGFFSLKETEKSVAEEGADPLTFGIKVVVGGHTMPFGVEGVTDRVSLPGLGGAYEAYAEEGFPARAYREIMDNSGIDYMIVYPTVGLLATAVPDMSAELGTAIRRAYNTWLGDFCSEAGGRVFGAASIDLRDPEAAAKEVRRCVKEMGFKGVHFNPTPVGDYSLYDEACDPLWAEISDLDVPVGVHPAAGSAADIMIYHYLPGLMQTQGSMAFAFGNMIACASFIMGGVLERHPKLRVVYLESGAGWAGYWLDRMASGMNGGFRGLEVPGLHLHPIEFFQRQCFVSSDQDDPGIKMTIDVIGDENIVTATDFSHPEGRRYAEAVDMLLDLPGVSDESKRKILWDNPLRLYPIKPAA